MTHKRTRRTDVLKIVAMGPAGAGKTTLVGSLARHDEHAPLILFQAETGGEPLRRQILEGRIFRVPVTSEVDLEKWIDMIQMGPVRYVEPSWGYPYLEPSDQTFDPDKPLDPDCFHPRAACLDSLSALARWVLADEQKIATARARLGVGDQNGTPSADSDGNYRRARYGINSAKDFWSGVRNRLGGVYNQMTRLTYLGISALITVSPKIVHNGDGAWQPLLPGGEEYGKMSRDLLLWARYYWSLYAEGGTHYALTRELSQAQYEDDDWAWAAPFGSWAKSSPPDDLRPIRESVLPQMLADPDLTRWVNTRDLALKMVDEGASLKTPDDRQAFLDALAERGGHVIRRDKETLTREAYEAVMYACEAAGVAPPAEVSSYFDAE